MRDWTPSLGPSRQKRRCIKTVPELRWNGREWFALSPYAMGAALTGNTAAKCRSSNNGCPCPRLTCPRQASMHAWATTRPGDVAGVLSAVSFDLSTLQLVSLFRHPHPVALGAFLPSFSTLVACDPSPAPRLSILGGLCASQLPRPITQQQRSFSLIACSSIHQRAPSSISRRHG
jgi:hypothetical protein